jgi:excisionase family DNA binding protein
MQSKVPAPPVAEPPFLTVDEAAKFLRCARFTVDKLVNTGVVRYQKLGRRNLIHRGDLLKYIEQHWVKEGVL